MFRINWIIFLYFLQVVILFQILLDMVITGALSHVDNLHMEWHGVTFYRDDRDAIMVDKLAKAVTNIGNNQIQVWVYHTVF